MIRVIIADDHALVRAGLRRLISDEPDLVVTGEAADTDGMMQQLGTGGADVVVLDVSMPGPGIIDTLAQLANEFPATRAIVLTMHPEEDYATRVIRAGAAAYLTKATSAHHLIAAIHHVHDGGTYVTSTVGRLIAAELLAPAEPDPMSLLSQREKEVLGMLGTGQGTKKIAAALGISPKTVSTYRARLIEKLGCSSAADLVRLAITRDLGPSDPL